MQNLYKMENDFKEFRDNYRETATLWFGKYRGVPIAEIPVEYLKWLKTQTTWYKQFSRSLKRAITYNINKGSS